MFIGVHIEIKCCECYSDTEELQRHMKMVLL